MPTNTTTTPASRTLDRSIFTQAQLDAIPEAAQGYTIRYDANDGSVYLQARIGNANWYCRPHQWLNLRYYEQPGQLGQAGAAQVGGLTMDHGVMLNRISQPAGTLQTNDAGIGPIAFQGVSDATTTTAEQCPTPTPFPATPQAQSLDTLLLPLAIVAAAVLVFVGLRRGRQ